MNALRAFVAVMTGGQAMMLALSTMAALGAILIFALFDDRFVQITIVGLLVIILFLGARVALPPEAHRMRTARFAVWVFGGILIGIAGAKQYTDAIIVSAIELFSPDLADRLPRSAEAPVSLVLIIALIMFVCIMFFLREPAPLGKIARGPLIRESSYRDRRAAFVDVLRYHLQRVDEDLRWHHRDFVALRAEVDIRNTGRARRRVTDLVEAIKQNQDANIFVVVGVPGAGKSVALRKCCMDLLATQRATERIPVYVNLKEWTASRRWTAESPPTDAEFAQFVRTNVRERLPDSVQTFFQAHFDQLVNAGEIFFLFDSFDEIPGILDADETSRLLDAVSAVIVRYLRGHPHGRGVIASRYYRRPRLGQEKYAQLDVRPFSERQIAQAVSQGASRPDALKQLLFKDRPELGALARNPFTLSLILLYWERETAGPPNQSALFAAYIDHSLSDARENLEAAGVDPGTLRRAMADISWTMFESDRRGLEMTVGELRRTLGRDDMDVIVDALVAARLARKAPRTQAVSFVHRRFNEYFLVARWLSGERPAPFNAIPTDSRYRDALVLYAEVASDAEAAQLAVFCWSEVEAFLPSTTTDSAAVLRGIYSLRFLAEAFRVRLAPTAAFREALGQSVSNVLTESDDMLTRKIAVESVGLLNRDASEAVLLTAISIGNAWITDAAFGACRYLPAISRPVEDALLSNLASRSQSWILVPDREFRFTLNLADAFSPLRKRFAALRYDVWQSVAAGLTFVGVLELRVRGIGLLLELLLAAAMLIGSILPAPRLPSRIPLFRYIMRAMRKTKWKRSFLDDVFDGIFRGSRMRGVDDILFGSVRFVALLGALAVLAALSLSLFLPLFNKPVELAFGSVAFERLESIVGAIVEAPVTIGIVSLLAAFGAIPYATIYIQISRTSVRSAVAAILKVCVVVVKLAVFAGVAIWIAAKYLPIEALLYTAAGLVIPVATLFACVVGTLMSWSIVVSIRDWYRDRRRLASILTRFNPSRAVIAESFLAFATDVARLKYVRWIDREGQAAENLAKLREIERNPWPSGRRPNVEDSEASAELAKLDARWIGLDA